MGMNGVQKFKKMGHRSGHNQEMAKSLMLESIKSQEPSTIKRDFQHQTNQNNDKKRVANN